MRPWGLQTTEEGERGLTEENSRGAGVKDEEGLRTTEEGAERLMEEDS